MTNRVQSTPTLETNQLAEQNLFGSSLATCEDLIESVPTNVFTNVINQAQSTPVLGANQVVLNNVLGSSSAIPQEDILIQPDPTQR